MSSGVSFARRVPVSGEWLLKEGRKEEGREGHSLDAERRRDNERLAGGSDSDRDPAQTVTVTGEVAIHRAVRRKTAQPMESIATRSLGEVSLVLIPAKKSADANRTTPST